MEVKSLKELQDVFAEFLLLGDRNVVKLITGVVVANQLNYLDPVWILLVSPPSSGKTEILQAYNDIIDPRTNKKLVYPISDLTTNTFASGQVRTGEETSLLFKMPYGGIMSYKDFTSILSKNIEAKQEIMGQLREIYDGAYTKRTGNNKDVTWQGKIGAIAGCTEIVYEHIESLSVMGDRFAMYSIVQPDRTAVLRFAIEQKRSGMSKDDARQKAREAVKSYMEHVMHDLDKYELSISQETENSIIEIADFCTKVRSGVVIDKKYNRIDFVPSKEMPMRLTEQLLALGTAFMIMRRKEPGDVMRGTEKANELSPNDMEILEKVAFDSIPIKRRMALKLLAKHKNGAHTAGLATAIGYETRVVAGWLSQLNGLGICKREKRMGSQGDLWVLYPEYAKIMIKFEGIQVVDEILSDESLSEDGEADWDQIPKSEFDDGWGQTPPLQ